jgi:hypothetical protein
MVRAMVAMALAYISHFELIDIDSELNSFLSFAQMFNTLQISYWKVN